MYLGSNEIAKYSLLPSWGQRTGKPVSVECIFHKHFFLTSLVLWTESSDALLSSSFSLFSSCLFSKAGVLHLSAMAPGAGQFLVGGLSCASWNVQSHPWSSLLPAVTTKYISGHCQMSPGGHSHFCSRTTDLDECFNRNIDVTSL